MIVKTRMLLVLATSLLICNLIACGGENEESTNNLSVFAGDDQVVDEETLVNLSGLTPDFLLVDSIKWTQTSGTHIVTLTDENYAIPNPSANFIAPKLLVTDVLVFTLTVTDINGVSVSDTISITVNPVNALPSVDAGNGIRAVEYSEIILTGSATDSDGSIASYDWTQTGGPNVELINANTPSSSFTLNGIAENTWLEFTLTVEDNEMGISADTVEIEVLALSDNYRPLNDTGVTGCSDEDNNLLDCPVVAYEGQDAEYGRDVGDENDSDGNAGFRFKKLDASGNPTELEANEWNCVEDEVTGLIWEHKTAQGGLHDRNNRFSWFNSDPSTNGGNSGLEDGGTCANSGSCDTEKFITLVNQYALCGYNDWRLPTVRELQSIIDFQMSGPPVDITFFPNLLASDSLWTSQTAGTIISRAYILSLSNGRIVTSEKSYGNLSSAILVRSE